MQAYGTKEIAEAKGLDVAWLRGLGVSDVPGGGVSIPYYSEDGATLFRRERDTPNCQRSGAKVMQPRSTRLQPYGLWKLDECRRAGFAYLCEGESDTWALWASGVAALGLPGAQSGKALDAATAKALTAIYLVPDNDNAGELFVSNVAKRLAELGWQGRLWRVRVPVAHKDASDWRVADVARFAEALADARADAEGVPLPDPRATNGVNGTGHAKPHEANGLPAEPKEPPLEIALPAMQPWPEEPAPAAYYGLLGDVLERIAPQTEADPVAILVQTLGMFGSAIGRKPHWRVEDDRHYGNLFVCIVGDTSVGRKGVSLGRARQCFAALDDEWAKTRIYSGLSSGEGLIHAVRDERYGTHQVKQRGRVVDTQTVLEDKGVTDKRLLVLESEFARPLLAMRRKGNTLSAILRQAWDSGYLASMTKNTALRATDAHVSILGHVTRSELRRHLEDVESTNGFVNRFLWVAARRSRLLPFGGERVDLGPLTCRIAYAVEEAQRVGEVGLADDARELWIDTYARLNEPREGLMGAILARGPAQIRRVAMLYALLDHAPEVRCVHLSAALALWDYCERSCRWIFDANGTGSPVADEILAGVEASPTGLSRTEIARSIFGHRIQSYDLTRALVLLRDLGMLREEKAFPNGRPVIRFTSTRAKSAHSAHSGQSDNRRNDLQQKG